MRLHEFVPLLYHGSDKSGLTILIPQPSKLTKKPAVFAATYPEIAVAMANHWTDDDFEFGRDLSSDDDPDDIPYDMIELRPNAFNDFFRTSIYVYTLYGDDFHKDENLQDFELVSFKPIEIIHEQHIRHPLAYLKQSKMVNIIPYKNS